MADPTAKKDQTDPMQPSPVATPTTRESVPGHTLPAVDPIAVDEPTARLLNKWPSVATLVADLDRHVAHTQGLYSDKQVLQDVADYLRHGLHAFTEAATAGEGEGKA